jgi:ligand-binding sensor domain-containing protein
MKKSINKIILLILIVSGGLVKAQTITNYTTTDGLPDNFIIGGVAVDSNNNKWFGTAAGVAKFNNTAWSVYTTTDGLIDNYTTCIAVDKNNNVWVGTNNGVSKFNGTSWTSYTTTEGLIDNAVVYIAGDNDGSVWFATSVGVSKLNGSTWTNYTTTDGLPTDVINYIATDPSNQKWFGTQLNGVSIYNNSTFNNISTTTMDSLVDDNVYAIAFDKTGQKWIGTRYGITKLGTANNWLKNYRPVDGLYNEWVHDIKIDSNNNVWVVLFTDYNVDGGISVFNGTTWHSYSLTDGLADKQVIRLAVDKNNDVWVATGNGVSKIHQTSSIGDYSKENAWGIYPNPFTDKIEISNTTGKELYELRNIMGQIIWKGQQIGQHNFSALQSGVYFLKVDNITTSQVIKLIKE